MVEIDKNLEPSIRFDEIYFHLREFALDLFRNGANPHDLTKALRGLADVIQQESDPIKSNKIVVPNDLEPSSPVLHSTIEIRIESEFADIADDDDDFYGRLLNDSIEYRRWHDLRGRQNRLTLGGDFRLGNAVLIEMWQSYQEIAMYHRETGTIPLFIGAQDVVRSADYLMKLYAVLGNRDDLIDVYIKGTALSDVWEIDVDTLMKNSLKYEDDIEVSTKILLAIGSEPGLRRSLLWKKIEYSGIGRAYIIDTMKNLNLIEVLASPDGYHLFLRTNSGTPSIA